MRLVDDRDTGYALEEAFAWGDGQQVRWSRYGSGPALVFCHGTPWSSAHLVQFDAPEHLTAILQRWLMARSNQ